jgi:hypothetical protein
LYKFIKLFKKFTLKFMYFQGKKIFLLKIEKI